MFNALKSMIGLANKEEKRLAEEERVAEILEKERRAEEEWRLAEEQRRVEERRRAEEQRRAEERRRAEEEQKKRLAAQSVKTETYGEVKFDITSLIPDFEILEKEVRRSLEREMKIFSNKALVENYLEMLNSRPKNCLKQLIGEAEKDIMGDKEMEKAIDDFEQSVSRNIDPNEGDLRKIYLKILDSKVLAVRVLVKYVIRAFCEKILSGVKEKMGVESESVNQIQIKVGDEETECRRQFVVGRFEELCDISPFTISETRIINGRECTPLSRVQFIAMSIGQNIAIVDLGAICGVEILESSILGKPLGRSVKGQRKVFFVQPGETVQIGVPTLTLTNEPVRLTNVVVK